MTALNALLVAIGVGIFVAIVVGIVENARERHEDQQHIDGRKRSDARETNTQSDALA